MLHYDVHHAIIIIVSVTIVIITHAASVRRFAHGLSQPRADPLPRVRCCLTPHPMSSRASRCHASSPCWATTTPASHTSMTSQQRSTSHNITYTHSRTDPSYSSNTAAVSADHRPLPLLCCPPLLSGSLWRSWTVSSARVGCTVAMSCTESFRSFATFSSSSQLCGTRRQQQRRQQQPSLPSPCLSPPSPPTVLVLLPISPLSRKSRSLPPTTRTCGLLPLLHRRRVGRLSR